MTSPAAAGRSRSLSLLAAAERYAAACAGLLDIERQLRDGGSCTKVRAWLDDAIPLAIPCPTTCLQDLRADCEEEGRRWYDLGEVDLVGALCAVCLRRAGTCRWADCWCRAWPRVRLILSTGQLYTVEEIEPDGAVRVFRYLYLDGVA